MWKGVNMPSDQHLQYPSPPDPVSKEAAVERPLNASAKTITHRLSGLLQRVQHTLRRVNGNKVVNHGASPAAHADDSGSEGSEHGLISQINGLDHEHMQAFPAHRKAQVMAKIMSLTPIRNEVHQGNNKFAKAVLRLHRDGYGLIDVQPQETVFTTVWYRKNSAFGNSADATMLLCEEDENGASITMMSWRI